MSPAFLRSVNFTLGWEGGYDHDPDDPGGETNFGIDKRSHPAVDIRGLTREGAIAIYHDDYWRPMRCEEYRPNLAVVVFDIAVNNGKARSARWLQEEVGANPDGIIGARTLSAVASSDQQRTAERLLDRRHDFYESIARGRQAKYLRGWLNRNHALRELIAA